jgi:hypothetical protein
MIDLVGPDVLALQEVGPIDVLATSTRRARSTSTSASPVPPTAAASASR